MQTCNSRSTQPDLPRSAQDGHHRLLACSGSPILREALAGAGIVLCLSLLLDPGSPALASWAVHPGWLIVLILAARYGTLGFLAGTSGAALGAALAALCARAALQPLAERVSSQPDLAAAVAGVLVGWVGSSHHKRARALAADLTMTTTRAHDGEEAVVRLTEAAIALRARADRTESSLAFLSDIAERIETASPRRGAEAALELAVARTGARAGIVQIAHDGRLRMLAAHGAWSLDSLEPPAVHRDRTAYAALQHGHPVLASEVAGVRADDSDLAAPIVRSDGRVVGMIALRGVPFVAVKAASLSDLNVVARWLSRVLPLESEAGPMDSNRWCVDAG
jgi:hypothetical protein